MKMLRPLPNQGKISQARLAMTCKEKNYASDKGQIFQLNAVWEQKCRKLAENSSVVFKHNLAICSGASWQTSLC